MGKMINTSFKQFLKENYSDSNNDLAQQYIDIIDMDSKNPKYDKYKKILKDNFGIEYVSPEERYSSEIEFIESIDNVDFETTTSKGLPLRIVSNKVPNLLKTLHLKAYNEGMLIASLGFNVDLENNTLRIGGAEVKEEYRRQGVYTEMIKIVLDICKDNNLELIESGRSEDAKNFWDSIDL